MVGLRDQVVDALAARGQRRHADADDSWDFALQGIETVQSSIEDS